MKRLILSAALLAVGCSGAQATPPAPTVAPTSAPQPFAVLGDSISAGYNPGSGFVANDSAHAWPAYASALVGRPVVNLAITGGDELVAASVVPQIPANVTTVVYAGGTNDIAHANLPDAQLVARIDDIVARIHAQVPKAQIVFLDVRRFAGIPNDSLIGPYGLDSTIWHQETAWNDHEKAFGYPLVDVQDLGFTDQAAYPDGIHPSPAQVQVLAGLMAPVLR